MASFIAAKVGIAEGDLALTPAINPENIRRSPKQEFQITYVVLSIFPQNSQHLPLNTHIRGSRIDWSHLAI